MMNYMTTSKRKRKILRAIARLFILLKKYGVTSREMNELRSVIVESYFNVQNMDPYHFEG